jgi:TolB-like protein/tetratricopeptide (TPR) repeat protein
MTYAALVVFVATAFLIGRALYQKQFLEREVLGLAVLPMSNIGAPDREYFTDGVSDELTTRLSAIAGLRVISRTSAMRYKDSTKSIPEIARALNVDLIVEGTVRWDSSETGLRMRITPRLIRARDEQALWSETYDRSFAEVLLTQAEIAEAVTAKIGEQLGQTLSLPRQTLPTTSVEAYNYYLRGSEYLNRGFERPDLDIAIAQFARALTLDSTFAAAHARLSRAHSKYYWFHEEGDRARLSLARVAAETALRLAPNLPESHLALGYCLYWGDRDFETALDQFYQVRNLEPSNADAHFAIGGILRRLGRFEEAITNLIHASNLDALSANRAFEVGNTYYHMRRCAEADSFFSRAIALAPDQQPIAYWRKTLNYIHCDGTTERAREFVASWIDRLGADLFPLLFELDRLDGLYDSALAWISLSTMDSVRYFTKAAQVNRGLNREDMAMAQLDSARAILETRLLADSADPDILGELGTVYARLGRFEEAIRAAERAVELRPTAADAFGGPYYVEQLAEVYMLASRHDRAVAQLAILLASNNPLSKHTLLLDNTWAPLWDNPRFRQLVQ